MNIIAIKSVVSKNGKPFILVTTADRDHWVAYGMWTSRGLSANLEAYVGGSFEGDYFQAGETLLNGDEAQDSNIILRDFVATQNPTVLAGAIAMENQLKATKLNDAAAIFRRRRTEAAAKATADVAPAPVADPVVEQAASLSNV